jgi:hypothetical protein
MKSYWNQIIEKLQDIYQLRFAGMIRRMKSYIKTKKWAELKTFMFCP